MGLGPRSYAAKSCEGCEGASARARNWEQMIEK